MAILYQLCRVYEVIQVTQVYQVSPRKSEISAIYVHTVAFFREMWTIVAGGHTHLRWGVLRQKCGWGGGGGNAGCLSCVCRPRSVTH